MTYEEWMHSSGSIPLNEESLKDRRLRASTWVIYVRMASLDWYERTVLGLGKPSPISTTRIAELEHHTRQTIHHHLSILVASGWAERVKAGHYRPLQVCPDLPQRRKSSAG